MPAGYPAVTNVESTYGNDFTFEISDLRVAERLPVDLASVGLLPDFHLMPAAPLPEPVAPGRLPKQTTPPSNIVPINPDPDADSNDMFYLGLDVAFKGEQLGEPGMPETVDLEVRFYLEAYGSAVGPTERHEIDIQPQLFAGLNTVPGGGAAGEIRHQLWVQVAEANPAIIEAPAAEPWEDLFTPETVYRVAASVKIKDANLRPQIKPTGLGFLAGAAMQTIETT